MPGIGRMPVPLPVPGRGIGRVGILPIMPFGRVHRTFGILGAVVVGGVILGRMSRQDGVEVTRQTRTVVDRDRDREVVETYQTKDGGNQVTITAAPVQRVSDIKDDPVLKQTADTAKQASAESDKDTSKNKKAKGKETKSDAKIESEFLKVDQLPPTRSAARSRPSSRSRARRAATSSSRLAARTAPPTRRPTLRSSARPPAANGSRPRPEAHPVRLSFYVRRGLGLASIVLRPGPSRTRLATAPGSGAWLSAVALRLREPQQRPRAERRRWPPKQTRSPSSSSRMRSSRSPTRWRSRSAGPPTRAC